MRNTAILCVIKDRHTKKTIYTHFIQKVPRIGEQIYIGKNWQGEAIKVEYVLNDEDASQTVYITLEN